MTCWSLKKSAFRHKPKHLKSELDASASSSAVKLSCSSLGRRRYLQICQLRPLSNSDLILSERMTRITHDGFLSRASKILANPTNSTRSRSVTKEAKRACRECLRTCRSRGVQTMPDYHMVRIWRDIYRTGSPSLPISDLKKRRDSSFQFGEIRKIQR
jgi:hypothetical protein